MFSLLVSIILQMNINKIIFSLQLWLSLCGREEMPVSIKLIKQFI